MGDGKRLRSGGGQNQTLQSIAAYNCGKSVNSAFYSASGRYLVSTTMANKLDIFDDIHLSKVEEESRKVSLSQSAALKPFRSIVHDNMTGRWLTTFHAVCHPQTDLFAVGSMQKPRRIDLLDPCLAELNDSSRNASSASMSALSGDDLTAIISRFAFHPRTDRLVLAGGNSSGRVTVVM